MSNAAHITSDLKFAIVNDASDGGKISIGKRGVLLTVIGNEMVGTEVAAELDNVITAKIRGKKPFFEFVAENLEKNHLCVSYQEQTNALYVIGISDLVVGFAVPETIKPDHIRAVAVKLKPSPGGSIMANHAVLIRMEGVMGKPRSLAFYLIDSSAG